MHKNDLRLTALLCGVVAALAAGSASAGLQDGLRAVERNDWDEGTYFGPVNSRV